MKYYIATSLGSVEYHNIVRDILSAQGSYEITHDWTTHGVTKEPTAGELQQRASYDVQGVKDADVLIVLLPGGRGTHVEIGIALADNKPVIICARNYHDLLSPYPCAFHWLDSCIRLVGGHKSEMAYRILRTVEMIESQKHDYWDRLQEESAQEEDIPF